MTKRRDVEDVAAGRDDAGARRQTIDWRRAAPLVVLVIGVAAFFSLGLDAYLSLDALRDHRQALGAFVARHGVLAPLIFMTVYAVAVALSLPGAAVMTIAGGVLFGNLVGTLWVVIGATVGATGLFVVAKTSLGDVLRVRCGPWLGKLEAGFQENAFNYLLVLRLMPVFPFFVVNLVPAFLGVPLRTYVIATLVGIIPGSFVFASVGAGLASLFVNDPTADVDIGAVLTPEIIIALSGLAVLSLAPVVYHKFKARRATGNHGG